MAVVHDPFGLPLFLHFGAKRSSRTSGRDVLAVSPSVIASSGVVVSSGVEVSPSVIASSGVVVSSGVEVSPV